MMEELEKPLIADTPDQFINIDIDVLKEKTIEERLSVFYTLQYPASTWFYHNIIGIGEEKNFNDNEHLRFLKYLGENDLYYFTTLILKKTKLRERPNRLMSEKIMIRPENNTTQIRKLIVEPRGTYKTTLASIGYPIWLLCKDPNLCILIDSETDKQAQSIYEAIKEEMEVNELLQMIYGVFESDKWNKEKMNIAQRTVVRRDPSVFHSGCDTSINGFHPDVVVLDDPCSEQNTQNSEMQEKVHGHYKLITPLLDKTGELLVIMTRWILGDLAGKILEKERDTYYAISIKSCYGINGESDSEKDGLYAPEILSKEYLEDAKKTMGMWRFSANYLNNPKPDTDKAFNVNWLQYYEGDMPVEMSDDGSIRKIPLDIYLSMDASWADATSKTGKDPTAIIVMGISDNGNIYILDIFNKRINPTEVIETMFRMVSMWNPRRVASEDIGTQKALNHQMDLEMAVRKIYFVIDRVKHQSRSKDSRILSLTPLFEQKKIFIRRDMKDFIEQYEYFSPNSNLAHDDILDALEMGVTEYRDMNFDNDDDDEEFEEEYFEVYDERTGRM